MEYNFNKDFFETKNILFTKVFHTYSHQFSQLTNEKLTVVDRILNFVGKENLIKYNTTIMKRKIAIAADHAGFEYKEIIKKHLEEQFEVQDFGTYSTDSVDYPDFVHPAATSVENGENELGILICGSGNGVQITANKHQKIRCALCWMPEIAELARQHNDANMISIPARFIAKEVAIEIVNKFLSTDFEGGRHQNRVDKIAYC